MEEAACGWCFVLGGLSSALPRCCEESTLRMKALNDFGFFYKYTKKQAHAASALKGAGDPRSFSSDDLVHVWLKRDL